jgi:thioesterase domain-containing protein
MATATHKWIGTDGLAVKRPRDSFEGLVASAWRGATGQPPASVLEDFFMAGHTSVHAAVLIGLLREALRERVPLRLLFERPTVAGLASALRERRQEWRNDYVFRLREGDRAPVVLAPGTSGTLGWISTLADERLDRPVYGLASKGVYGECPPLATLEEIADHLLETLRAEGITGPLHLVGSCVGGLACLPMAHRAARHGVAIASITLLNGSFRPDTMSRLARLQYRLDEIRTMAGREPTGEPADEAGAPAAIEALFREVAGAHTVVESTLREFAAKIQVFVANWAAAANHAPAPVPVPLTLLYRRGLEDDVGLRGWQALGCACVPVEGLEAADVGRPDVLDLLAKVFDAGEPAR